MGDTLGHIAVCASILHGMDKLDGVKQVSDIPVMSVHVATEQIMNGYLNSVRDLMFRYLRETTLRLLDRDVERLMAGGKMLRARMPFRIGQATGVSHNTLLHVAAVTEMIHTASLLHDDVIDGGVLRRGAPSFWVERGVSGAILLGDMLLFKALDVICKVENARLAQPLVRFAGEVCQAESEQELILRGREIDWDDCVRIARGKTGALFAFTAYACGGADPKLTEALKEAGYDVGTAYQLSDDILDAKGSPTAAGKTLGTDSARSKNTVMSCLPANGNPIAYIEDLCESARARLAPWPDVQQAWEEYMAQDLMPGMEEHLQLMYS